MNTIRKRKSSSRRKELAISFRLFVLLALSRISPASSVDGSWFSDSFSWSSGGDGGRTGNGGIPLAINSAKCGNGLTLSGYEATCDDGSSSYCTLDETMSIRANIQLDNDLESPYVYVTVEACVGACDTLMDSKRLNICNALSSTSGSECPGAGTYELYVPNFRLPACGNDCDGWDDGYVAGAMYFLYITLDGEDGEIGECDVELITASDEGWNAYGSVAIAALVGSTIIALAAYLGGGRRRLVACSCNGSVDDTLDYESDEGGNPHEKKAPSSNFEMM